MSFWRHFSDSLGSFKGNRLLKSSKHENISLDSEGYKEDTTAISRNRSTGSEGIPLCGVDFGNQVPEWVMPQAFCVHPGKEMLPTRQVLCYVVGAEWGGGGHVGLAEQRPAIQTQFLYTQHVTPWGVLGGLLASVSSSYNERLWTTDF